MTRVTFDSNILVYAAQRADPRQEMAADLLVRAASADCVQTLQSLCECFHVLRRKRLFEAHRAQSVIDRYRQLFDVAVSSLSDLDRAIHVSAQHGLQFWDTFMWATARRAGCRVIITEDQQDGRILEGVRFVNPFKPANGGLIDLILPPGEA
ncbi:PIN domain-containing protein [Marinimicrococcus flavescens]|uniref:PIN domain-containing protein n=1 Tax=Marinimicrococcus flavescens TaxID=3031815 RepID=A0AAP3XPM9_9PROT|nr:PIN domain-containing protein [Marinimicrococcus flavescens]